MELNVAKKSKSKSKSSKSKSSKSKKTRRTKAKKVVDEEPETESVEPETVEPETVEHETGSETPPVVVQKSKTKKSKKSKKSKKTKKEDSLSGEVEVNESNENSNIIEEKSTVTNNEANGTDEADVDDAVDETTYDTVKLRIKDTITVVKNVLRELRNLTADVQTLKKQGGKQKKKRKKNKNPNIKSGILKLHPVHPKVAEFLGVDEDAEKSRVNLLQGITTYVKENKLQDPDNRKFFNITGKLRTLFTGDDGKPLIVYCKKDKTKTEPVGDQISYTDIMRCIAPFFKKIEIVDEKIQVEETA